MSIKDITKVLSEKWKNPVEINSGGQGKVFEVIGNEDGKKYAAKLFYVKKGNEEKLGRVKTEIAAIKKLDGSSNIVKIYDDNSEDFDPNNSGHIYYVMDYAKFGSLRDNDFYKEDVELTLRIFKEILIGVKNAHDLGVIHRDLKPENILFFPTQKNILISDFGLGLLIDRSEEEKITKENEFLGPRFFISPEQFVNPSEVNERSDIYSLGKILFFMLTGQDKVHREDCDLNDYFSGSNTLIPLIQDKLLSRMISEDQNDRFSGVDSLIDEVGAIIKEIEINSLRFPEKKMRENIFVRYLSSSKEREKFIAEFAKDIFISLSILSAYSESLLKQGKNLSVDKIHNELYEKFPTGKVHILIKSQEAYLRNPKDLKKLIEKYKKSSFPLYYQAQYFLKAKSYGTAHGCIQKAIDMESDREFKLKYVLLLLELSKDCRCSMDHKADTQLRMLLLEAKLKEEKAALYKIIGEYYLETGEKEKGIRFLASYLDSDPSDNGTRFNCAWEADQVEEYGLSLYHYKINLDSNEDHDGSINNIGRIYAVKDMKIASMDMYQKAYKLGNTISGGNIALKYLDAGLKDKSLEILREIIRNHKTYAESVEKAFASIYKTLDEEKAKKEKLLRDGGIINYHNIEYVKQLSTSNVYSWDGYWDIEDKGFIKISSDKIEDFCDSKVKITGKFDTNCFEISNCSLGYLKDYKKGIFYLKSNDSFVGYVQNDSELIEIKAKRIQDPDKFIEKQKEKVNLFSSYLNKL